MKFRDRILAVVSGEEPDKIPVGAFNMLRKTPQGGWLRRLMKRGMGIINTVPIHTPTFFPPIWVNPYLDDVRYTVTYYTERGIKKYRHSFETPVGIVSGVMMINPISIPLNLEVQEEYFIKAKDDWHVINYIFKGILNKLKPNYDVFERAEDELGDDGICFAFVDKTAWQRAWIELAPPEKAVIDFHENNEEIQEFINIQNRIHYRIAEFAAESPAKIIDIADNITDMTSPKYYSQFCMPIYKYYQKLLTNSNKFLASHMDGRLNHLREEISESDLNIIESFTLPPVGNISLSEARLIWPGKVFFINTPPHLSWSDYDEVKKGYEDIASEWGNKKGLLLEHSEDLPLEKVEMHMSAALDVFGY